MHHRATLLEFFVLAANLSCLCHPVRFVHQHLPCDVLWTKRDLKQASAGWIYTSRKCDSRGIFISYLSFSSTSRIFIYFEELMRMSRRIWFVYENAKSRREQKKKERMIFNNDCRRETILFGRNDSNSILYELDPLSTTYERTIVAFSPADFRRCTISNDIMED